MSLKNALVGIFSITFMPITTGGAALKQMLGEQGINPYSIPFKALKEIARERYELAKWSSTKDNPFMGQYVSFLQIDSYAIVA
jgi:hypothetical protein